VSRLVVDLGQLATNIRAMRERVEPADFLFVLKDDAYGHGVEPVALAAARAGVRWFGAVDVPTCLTARAVVGPDARILAWSRAPRDLVSAAIESGLDLGVGDAGYLDEVAAVSAGRRARVHLKIDTGLRRSGVRPEEWSAFVARAAELEASRDISVTGIWSHIAETSNADDDDARALFAWAVEAAVSAGLTPEVRHLAASAAAHARGEFRFDLARIGAFGYGIRSAGGAVLDGIAPAATLFGRVSAVGDGGVEIDLGALDGLPSSLAGRVEVGTPGGPRALTVIGPTSATVDAWPTAAVGDEVAVFGPGRLGEHDATTLAEAIGTVGEELLVRVSPLVPREYTR
jgi:alanine racemase